MIFTIFTIAFERSLLHQVYIAICFCRPTCIAFIVIVGEILDPFGKKSFSEFRTRTSVHLQEIYIHDYADIETSNAKELIAEITPHVSVAKIMFLFSYKPLGMVRANKSSVKTYSLNLLCCECLHFITLLCQYSHPEHY